MRFGLFYPCVWMTGASFPCSIRGVSDQHTGMCPAASVSPTPAPAPLLALAAQELALEQVCMGKTALLRPKSSFRYICSVSGFISLSVLSYKIRKPSAPSCGITMLAGWWQSSECQYLFPPEKVNAQHFRAVAPWPFQSTDRWKWLCGERPGQEGSWQPF